MKKSFHLLAVLLASTTLMACNTTTSSSNSTESSSSSVVTFDTTKSIKAYTRDTTSGTRDGFFTGIDFKDAIKDNSVLVDGYVEVESNGAIIQSIKNDDFGIGYISLSSLANSTLKGLNYENVEPTEANVIAGTYGLTRTFNYMTRVDYTDAKIGGIVEAYVAYMSTIDGKATIKGADGIVKVEATDKTWDAIKADYSVCAEDNSAITVKFGGSTSVEKVSKALSAEFKGKCGNFVPEHNHTGSGDAYKRTQGSEKDGADLLHIGFASREFKITSDEPAAANTYGYINTDAIVAVVSSKNSVIDNVTATTLKSIYDGTFTKWSDVA